MSKYLSFEEESVTSIIKLSENIDDESFRSFVNVSILALCGYDYNLNDITLTNSKNQINNDINGINIIEFLYFMGKIYWEIVKASPITNDVLKDIFVSLKLSTNKAKICADLFDTHIDRLVELKRDAKFATSHFDNLTWRLDMEILRRNGGVIMQPEYLFNLTLKENKTEVEKVTYKLRSNYANMKKMLDSLQDAQKELSRNHSLRFVRYIS